jgi:mono/diheme cytochrome c family protein
MNSKRGVLSIFRQKSWRKPSSNFCRRPVFIFVPILFWVLGCTQKPAEPLDPAQALIAQGRSVYRTTCIACHNPDPKLPGSIGPDVYGSSKELLTARVLRAAYPPGYHPKRNTGAMAAFPSLSGQIDALHAYLNSPQP